jgi:hypothetical protein
MEVNIHAFLAVALYRGETSASGPGHFAPANRASGTKWVQGGGVKQRACYTR